VHQLTCHSEFLLHWTRHCRSDFAVAVHGGGEDHRSSAAVAVAVAVAAVALGTVQESSGETQRVGEVALLPHIEELTAQ